METVMLLILIIVLVVGFAITIFILSQRLKELQQKGAAELIKQDVVELTRGVGQLREGLQKTVDARLEHSHASMQRQLSQSAKLVADVTQRLTKLDETNRRVVDVADELKTLQNVLQNPKQRGVFGEYYLESVLNNVLPPGRFQMQYKFKDGEAVDAVIFLEDEQVLPIDSKFSLENYNRFVEEKDKTERVKLLAQLRIDLKGRIDETSKYIRPSENTMDFAFMFIPSEALYYDLLMNHVGAGSSASRDLVEYAFRDKKVIIVSPTSFMAYLQTVLQGLRSLQIESQAKEIQKRVGDLGKHLGAYDTYMHKLGNSLSTTVNHYNAAHKELKKVDKDVVKISKTTPAIEPLTIDRPQKED